LRAAFVLLLTATLKARMFESEEPNLPPDGDGDLLEATLDSISVTNVGFILFLRIARESRVLPIFVGSNEAQAIALALNEDPPPRPLTHDLMKTILEALEASVTRVEIVAIRDGTFFGRVQLQKSGFVELEFDARPSDAIAMALRWEAPIFVRRGVFDEAAVPLAQKSGEGQDTGATGEELPAEEPLPSPVEKLQEELRTALGEERYEEAARLRDAIKKLSMGN
jgi:bifunctional DNase/RNase